MTRTQASIRTTKRLGNVTAVEEQIKLTSPSVACLNLSPRIGEVRLNLTLAEKVIIGVKRAHPLLRWVVLPELFTSGYADLPSVHLQAEDAERGVSARFFADLARGLDLYIAYGFPERLPDGAGSSVVADSANLIGPEGLFFTYRKRHLVRETGEDLVFVPGTELPVVEAGGMLVSLAICWDLGFPETVREAARKGAELVLVPAGWRDPFGLQYRLSCAARALDNSVYLASANQQGTYPEAEFGSPGGVYGPDGLRVSAGDGTVSVGRIKPFAPKLWRARYGSTFPEGDAEYTSRELIG